MGACTSKPIDAELQHTSNTKGHNSSDCESGAPKRRKPRDFRDTNGSSDATNQDLRPENAREPSKTKSKLTTLNRASKNTASVRPFNQTEGDCVDEDRDDQANTVNRPHSRLVLPDHSYESDEASSSSDVDHNHSYDGEFDDESDCGTGDDDGRKSMKSPQTSRSTTVTTTTRPTSTQGRLSTSGPEPISRSTSVVPLTLSLVTTAPANPSSSHSTTVPVPGSVVTAMPAPGYMEVSVSGGTPVVMTAKQTAHPFASPHPKATSNQSSHGVTGHKRNSSNSNIPQFSDFASKLHLSSELQDVYVESQMSSPDFEDDEFDVTGDQKLPLSFADRDIDACELQTDHDFSIPDYATPRNIDSLNGSGSGSGSHEESQQTNTLFLFSLLDKVDRSVENPDSSGFSTHSTGGSPITTSQTLVMPAMGPASLNIPRHSITPTYRSQKGEFTFQMPLPSRDRSNQAQTKTEMDAYLLNQDRRDSLSPHVTPKESNLRNEKNGELGTAKKDSDSVQVMQLQMGLESPDSQVKRLRQTSDYGPQMQKIKAPKIPPRTVPNQIPGNNKPNVSEGTEKESSKVGLPLIRRVPRVLSGNGPVYGQRTEQHLKSEAGMTSPIPPIPNRFSISPVQPSLGAKYELEQQSDTPEIALTRQVSHQQSMVLSKSILDVIQREASFSRSGIESADISENSKKSVEPELVPVKTEERQNSKLAQTNPPNFPSNLASIEISSMEFDAASLPEPLAIPLSSPKFLKGTNEPETDPSSTTIAPGAAWHAPAIPPRVSLKEEGINKTYVKTSQTPLKVLLSSVSSDAQDKNEDAIISLSKDYSKSNIDKKWAESSISQRSNDESNSLIHTESDGNISAFWHIQAHAMGISSRAMSPAATATDNNFLDNVSLPRNASLEQIVQSINADPLISSRAPKTSFSQVDPSAGLQSNLPTNMQIEVDENSTEASFSISKEIQPKPKPWAWSRAKLLSSNMISRILIESGVDDDEYLMSKLSSAGKDTNPEILAENASILEETLWKIASQSTGIAIVDSFNDNESRLRWTCRNKLGSNSESDVEEEDNDNEDNDFDDYDDDDDEDEDDDNGDESDEDEEAFNESKHANHALGSLAVEHLNDMLLRVASTKFPESNALNVEKVLNDLDMYRKEYTQRLGLQKAIYSNIMSTSANIPIEHIDTKSNPIRLTRSVALKILSEGMESIEDPDALVLTYRGISRLIGAELGWFVHRWRAYMVHVNPFVHGPEVFASELLRELSSKMSRRWQGFLPGSDLRTAHVSLTNLVYSLLRRRCVSSNANADDKINVVGVPRKVISEIYVPFLRQNLFSFNPKCSTYLLLRAKYQRTPILTAALSSAADARKILKVQTDHSIDSESNIPLFSPAPQMPSSALQEMKRHVPQMSPRAAIMISLRQMLLFEANSFATAISYAKRKLKHDETGVRVIVTSGSSLSPQKLNPNIKL